MNPRIDQIIAPVLVAPHTLLTSEMKEFVADAASGGVWVNRTPRQVIRMGVDGSTPGNIRNAVSVEHSSSPFIIGIVATFPPFGIRVSLQVANKRKSTSPGLGGNTQKLDAVIVGKFPNDLDYASIFVKVIGHKLSGGSRDDLYLRCMMNFASGVVQTKAPHFIYMWIPAINILNESVDIGTPVTIIRRPTDVPHWSMPDHVFGEATAVIMSAAKSYH